MWLNFRFRIRRRRFWRCKRWWHLILILLIHFWKLWWYVVLFPVKKKTFVVFYQLWFNSIWTFLFYHKYINYIGVTVRYVPYKFVIFHHSLIYDKIYTQPHLTLIFLHLLFEFIFFVSQKQYIFSCLITAFPHLDMKLKDDIMLHFSLDWCTI